MSGHDFVDLREIINVGEKDRELDDIGHFGARLSQNCLKVVERAVCLSDDAFDHRTGGGIQTDLPGAVNGVAGLDGLAVGTDGR